MIEKVELPECESNEISLAPVVRLHRLEGEYLLTVVNHLEREARVTVTFREEQAFAGGPGKRLELTVPARDGICTRWGSGRR